MNARNEIRRQIAEMFDVPPELLEPTAEEIERRAQRAKFERFRAEMPKRYAKAAEQITAQAHKDGWLPDGWRFVYAPTAMSAEESLAHTNAAVRARCTCRPGPRSTGERHDPDCSLQNTGGLS